jgi:hypothetical protein
MVGNSPRNTAFIEVGVVVRYTEYATEQPENRIALTDAYVDLAVADAEAHRLNAATSGKPVTYFVKIVRLHVDDLPLHPIK